MLQNMWHHYSHQAVYEMGEKSSVGGLQLVRLPVSSLSILQRWRIAWRRRASLLAPGSWICLQPSVRTQGSNSSSLHMPSVRSSTSSSDMPSWNTARSRNAQSPSSSSVPTDGQQSSLAWSNATKVRASVNDKCCCISRFIALAFSANRPSSRTLFVLQMIIPQLQ